MQEQKKKERWSRLMNEKDIRLYNTLQETHQNIEMANNYLRLAVFILIVAAGILLAKLIH